MSNYNYIIVVGSDYNLIIILLKERGWGYNKVTLKYRNTIQWIDLSKQLKNSSHPPKYVGCMYLFLAVYIPKV